MLRSAEPWAKAYPPANRLTNDVVIRLIRSGKAFKIFFTTETSAVALMELWRDRQRAQRFCFFVGSASGSESLRLGEETTIQQKIDALRAGKKIYSDIIHFYAYSQ